MFELPSSSVNPKRKKKYFETEQKKKNAECIEEKMYILKVVV